jgi:poly-gamma-glutamate synthesis protein (capsule biosynthesis protein)
MNQVGKSYIMIQVAKYCCLISLISLSTFELSAQVSFCAVGDVLLDRDVRKVIEKNGINYPFENIATLINENDLAFFNMECPLVKPSDGYPINKKYSFRAEPEYITGLKYAGFNIASVANNHTIDYGKSGFLKTIENLNKDSIYTIGGGTNQDEAFAPLLIKKDGETFAIFGVLEFLLEGTVFNENQPYPAFGQIDKLCKIIRELNSDIDNIIVSVHWGQENALIPTSKQIEYAHKIVDAGADLVLGHHPHVLQSIETYKDKLILYSLGNFIFDNTGKLQKESVIFRCQFKNKQLIKPELIPIYINNCKPEIASKQTSSDILEHLNKISKPFNTSLTLTDNIIKINYNQDKPIKELSAYNRSFYLFKNRITTYDSYNKKIQYFLPDTNFILIDADLLTKDNYFYIYSIVKSKTDNKSRIAVFPFSIEKNEFLKPSLDSHEDFNPWKIRLFDVDKDEIPEIIVGVNKSTRYYENEENRIFVFNTDKDYFFPKWLGSKLGNPIIDFKICQNTNRLVILEKSEVKNTNMVVTYKWNGFGFDNDKILFEIKNINNLKVQFQLLDYNFKTVL